MQDKMIPMKYQVYDALKEDITNGVYKPEQMLPSENELCSRFNVSRTTIIAALQMLQVDSIIYRKQGKGTFVSNPKFSRDFTSSKNTFFGIVESNKNICPSTQILQVRTQLLDSTMAQILGVAPNEKIVYIKRLRLIDDLPVAITCTHMLWEYGAKLLQIPLEQNFSITEYMRNTYLQSPVPGTTKLTVENIYGSDARLLEVEDGFTCCKTESVSYINKKPFELAYTLMRADKFEFIIKRIDY